jgi:hypothetical protein
MAAVSVVGAGWSPSLTTSGSHRARRRPSFLPRALPPSPSPKCVASRSTNNRNRHRLRRVLLRPAAAGPRELWQPGDPDDAPVRIDAPRGYSHGDDLTNLTLDEDERRLEPPLMDLLLDDDDEDDEEGDGMMGAGGWRGGGGRRSGGGKKKKRRGRSGSKFRRLRWPPTLGEGTVPRIARAVWAFVAVGGVVWAVWSAAKHVLFLGMGATAGLNSGGGMSATLTTAAVDSAALEALGGLAEGALTGLVVAPTAAALVAAGFELILRGLMAAAGPRWGCTS